MSKILSNLPIGSEVRISKILFRVLKVNIFIETLNCKSRKIWYNILSHYYTKIQFRDLKVLITHEKTN
jgi:hypothetical protein